MPAGGHASWANREAYDANREAAVEEVRALIAFVAGRSGLTFEELTRRCRKRSLVRLRAAVTWIARADISVPLMQNRARRQTVSFQLIARALGVNDHSTVMNLMRHAEVWREHDPQFAADCDLWLARWRIEPATPPSAPRPRVPAEACRKAKNDLSPDDHDAMRRLRASNAMVAALRAEHPERFPAGAEA